MEAVKMSVHDLSFLNLTEVEDLAKVRLEKQVYDYYAGAAETQSVARENIVSFSRIKLVPRMDMAFPVMVAPMAMQGMAHADREVGAAKAAAAAGIPYCLSTMSTSSQEELVGTNPNLLFQLYVIRNRDVVQGWVQNAERLGYKALVVTVDAPRLGKREADERNRFALPAGCELKVLEPLRAAQKAAAAAAAAEEEPVGAATGAPTPAEVAPGGSGHQSKEVSKAVRVRLVQEGRANEEGSGLMKLFACEVDDSLTWDFISWLRRVTSLPIVVKGVLAAEDAELAVRAGVDGIVVSNHGGRQLDYSPTALEVLPGILAAVRGRVPVLLDGGVRRGTDVLKALALGASGVLLGRPVLYGLAVGGQAGVVRVLELLRREFELAMALCGSTSVEQLGRKLLLLSHGDLPGQSRGRSPKSAAGTGDSMHRMLDRGEGKGSVQCPSWGWLSVVVLVAVGVGFILGRSGARS